MLGRCPALTMVGFKANRIATVSAKALPAGLRWLILTDNAVEQLPDELGQCDALQKLMLAGNRLRELPASLANCRNLELLRIAANRIERFPEWLLSLPRLSWLAYSGNPFSEGAEARAIDDAHVTNPLPGRRWRWASCWGREHPALSIAPPLWLILLMK